MREHLRPGAESDRISPRHPCAVRDEVATHCGADADHDRQRHRRSENEALHVHAHAITFRPWIEVRHPQAGQRNHESADTEHASHDPMPRAMSATDARRELKRADHRVRDDRENVQHHRERLREEACVVGRDSGSAGQLREPCRAGDRRHETQEDQARGNEPVGAAGCGRHRLILSVRRCGRPPSPPHRSPFARCLRRRAV